MEIISAPEYDPETGLPIDEEYLERGLPEFLRQSVENMKRSWARMDAGETDLHWDIYWCDLYSDINCAEVEQLITSRQASYLRREYLRT